MTQLRLDKVRLTSLVDTYINYDTPIGSVYISGSVANGATANFLTTIPYTRSRTRSDIYARNTVSGEKRPLAGGSRQSPYIFVSTETCTQLSQYDGTTITVTISVFNGTGGSISLVEQTLEISAVLYQVPF